MPLTSLLDLVRQHLQTSITPAPALVGFGYPTRTADLPAVAISISEVTERLRGIGRLPEATATGALRVDTTLDLANPVVTFPDEVVRLLSTDRKTVTLAHGPLVRADGTTTPPWGAADISVVRGSIHYIPVAGPPTSGHVQVLPATGQLVFAGKQPATGTIALGYFVGEWEVQTARYQGLLTFETFASSLDAVDALGRQIEAAFGNPRIAGLQSVSPAGWTPVGIADDTRGNSRSRALTYRFDYELIEPKLATGGGLITTVAVDSSPGPEHFDVTTEGS